MRQNQLRIVIDTNVWISFLIGKRLQGLQDLLAQQKIQLIVSQQLLMEIEIVTARPKLNRYFKREKVDQLIALLNIIANKVDIKSIESICRDPKDDFLLATSKYGKADFLITGDDDLLNMKQYLKTRIIKVSQFEALIKQYE